MATAKSASKSAPKSAVDAMQQVYAALEPFDDQARHRILESAMSLLGMRASGSAITAARTHGESLTPVHEPSQHTTHPQPPASGAPRPVSPIELIQQKGASTNPQKIAVFAYYREKIEGIHRFSRDDLGGYFAKAKERPPENYDRDFRKAVRLGWIYEDGTESYLTSKGLEAVEAGFANKGQPRGTAAKAPKARRGKAKKAAARRRSRT